MEQAASTAQTEPQKVAALMLRSPAGRILMLRRVDDGSWAFPAGGAKGTDNGREETARRETWEETGYRPIGPVRPLMHRIKDGVDCFTYVTDCPEEFAPRLNHEHDGWMWIEPARMLSEAASADPAAEADVKRDERKKKRKAKRADAFEPSEPRDPSGKWTDGGEIGGLRSIQTARQRGGWMFKAGETAPRSRWGAPETTSYHVAPSDIPDHWKSVTKSSGWSQFYDPEHVHEEDGQTIPNNQEEWDAALPEAQEPGVIYRGMSYEEYQNALRSGQFQSKGDWNIGDVQKGLTMWSSDPRQARSYASDFAPWQFKATPSRPAVIVALKDPGEEHHIYTVPNERREIGLKGTQPVANVSHIFTGHPAIMSTGMIDVRNRDGRLEEGGGVSPSSYLRWQREAAPAIHSDAARTILDALDALGASIGRLGAHYGRADDFDPSEPREPAGGPGGGQWTGGGAGGAARDPVERAGQGRPVEAPAGHPGGNLGRGGRSGLSGRERPQFAPAEPDAFHKALNAAKVTNPFAAAVAVYTPAEYSQMKTFLTPDGKGGVAIKPDGDIVSVFKAAGGPDGMADAALKLAVQNGGAKLDCYDTVLPTLYAKNGFRVVSRLKFDPAQAPPDWDQQKFARYNNGQPDVVFMVYDPQHQSSTGGQMAGTYDEAVALQDQAVKQVQARGAPLAPVSQSDVDDLLGSVPGAADKVAAVRERLMKTPSSDALTDFGGFTRPDGTYTPEREQVHQGIVRSYFDPLKVRRAMPKSGQQPTVTILGGRGGSGKSWFTSEGGPVDRSSAMYINSDDILEQLPGYEGWNAAKYHEEASHVANMIEQQARRLGLNVIHDATLRSPGSSAKRIAEYRKRGYRVAMHYVDVTPHTSAVRALNRFMKTGRYVDPAYVLGSTTNMDSFRQLAPSADDWALWSNEAEGQPQPTLVERKQQPQQQAA
jgi:8-oxo-dGTP pyrophosphatase MutT (NUDIX family)/predicted ABC-type ATPase